MTAPDSAVAQGLWSPPVAVSMPGAGGDSPDLAMDGSGNAVVVWTGRIGDDGVVRVSRYTAATGSWSAPIDLSAPGEPAGSGQVAMDSDGNAVVVWVRSNATDSIAQAAYYSAGTAAWGAVTDLSAPGQRATTPLVAMDGSGNAVAVWLRFDGAHDIVQATRFTAMTATWSAPVDLSPPGIRASAPALAVDSGGGAAVGWVLGVAFSLTTPNGVVQVARYDPGLDAWSAAASLARATDMFDGLFQPSVAIDVSGNVIAVWRLGRGGPEGRQAIQTARYTAATGTWTGVADLSAGADYRRELAGRDGPRRPRRRDLDEIQARRARRDATRRASDGGRPPSSRRPAVPTTGTRPSRSTATATP